MKSLSIVFLNLFLTTLVWADADDCNYNLSFANVTALVQDTDQVIQHDFSLSRNGSNNSNNCRNYRIFFSKGQANSYQRKAYVNSASVNYNLHRLVNMAGILKQYGDAGASNEYLEGMAQDRYSTYQQRIFVSIPSLASQNFPSSGNYVDNIQASLYNIRSNGTLVLSDTKNFSVTFIVNKKIEISLVDEGAPSDPTSTTKILDFGNLEQNLEKAADLRVVSNTPYQVWVSAYNRGNLKHAQGEGISYSMKVNNYSIPLSIGLPWPIGVGNETSSSGDRYNMRFKITESTEGKPTGLYQDIITITAAAN